MFEDMKHKQRFILELIEEIEKQGTIEPIENCFFECFNGSYVYVFHKRGSDADEMSEGLREAIENTPLKALLELKEKMASGYQAVVLSGGHGMRPMGEKPGEAYALKVDGSYDMDQKLADETPLVVGMGLKRLVGNIRYLDTIKKD